MSAPQHPSAAAKAVGFVEECRDGHVFGWAQVPGIPLMPAVLDVAVDGFPAGSVKANVFRADLRKLGVRDGFAAFRFAVPDRYRDGKTHHVTVTERVSKTVLEGIGLFRFDAAADRPTRDRMFLYSVVQSHTLDATAFISGLAAKRKLAFLAAYVPGNRLLAFHHDLIGLLSEMGFSVVLCLSRANDPGAAAGMTVPESKADACLIKDNLGYDFGSWFAGLAAARPHLQHVEEIVFLNDSVFGPLCPPNALASMIHSAQADVVGICDSYERSYHLQSFFLLFRKKVLESGILFDFASDYPFNNVKEDVIRDGEVALTQAMLAGGLTCEALFPYEVVARRWLDRAPDYLGAVRSLPEYTSDSDANLQHLLNLARRLRRGEPLNPAHFFWDILIERGCPFVKRELLFKNPMDVPLLARAPALMHASTYPLAHIREAAQVYGTSRVFF